MSDSSASQLGEVCRNFNMAFSAEEVAFSSNLVQTQNETQCSVPKGSIGQEKSLV